MDPAQQDTARVDLYWLPWAASEASMDGVHGERGPACGNRA